MLVPAINFLYTPSKAIPLKYIYYNPKDDTSSENPTTIPNLSEAIPLLFPIPSFFLFEILLHLNNIAEIIKPEPEWDDNKWKETGIKLAQQIWKSRRVLTEKKSEIQSPNSLLAYYSAFPTFLTNFFDGLF